MPRYAPLSHSAHFYAGIAAGDYAFALKQGVVPVVAEEVPELLATMMLGFVKSTAPEGYQLVAIQALETDNNVYVHTNGCWIGGYMPAWYRAHPFRLLPEANSDRLVLCVDETSPCFHAESEPGDQPLFDDDGRPVERIEQLTQFLGKLEGSRQLTQRAVGQLAEAGLIVPWKIEHSQRNGEPQWGGRREVHGLFRIDEPALRRLDAERLVTLNASGALSLAYSQLLSEHRRQSLARLYELRVEHHRQRVVSEQVDLESLFGGGNGELNLDFDS